MINFTSQNKQYTEIISTIVSFKNFLKSPNVTDANKMLRILPRFHKFCDKWKKKLISRKATNYLSVALKNTINVSQWAGPVLGERTLLLHDTYTLTSLCSCKAIIQYNYTVLISRCLLSNIYHGRHYFGRSYSFFFHDDLLLPFPCCKNLNYHAEI